MGRGTAGGHPARLPELLIAGPILPASADPGPVPGGAQAGCRGAGPGRLPGRGQRCFPELPWAQPGLHRVCGAGPGVPVVCRQDLRVTSGHRRLCLSQTQSSASSSPRQGHLGLVTGGHTRYTDHPSTLAGGVLRRPRGSSAPPDSEVPRPGAGPHERFHPGRWPSASWAQRDPQNLRAADLPG